MKFLSLVKQATLLALTALAGYASVIYQFSGIPTNTTPGGVPQAFELVVPDFLQIPAGANQIFHCSELSVALNCQGDVIFSVSGFPNQGYAATLQFGDTLPGPNSLYSFLTGAFGQVGTYYSWPVGDGRFDQGLLTVSLVTEQPVPEQPAPEPQSLLLAFSAFAVGAAVRTSGRRRKANPDEGRV